MSRVKKSVDIVGDFWTKYLNSDCLKREKLIEDTKCFEKTLRLLTAKKLAVKHKKLAFNQMMMSYFDDLIGVLEK